MADDFKVGDIVMLRSGGPEMTVAKEKYGIDDDEVECQWFGGRKLEWGRFPKASLIHVEPDD